MTEHHASCQCNQLRITAKADPEFVIVCNGQACQLRTGSPFGEGAYFKKNVVQVDGEFKNWSSTAQSGRKLTNHFCPNCGTNLFWSLEMRPDFFGTGVGNFSTKLPEPIRAIWTEEKHD